MTVTTKSKPDESNAKRQAALQRKREIAKKVQSMLWETEVAEGPILTPIGTGNMFARRAQKGDHYRVETDGSVYTVTQLSRRFWFFGEWVWKPIYTSAREYAPRELVYFNDQESAQVACDTMNKCEISRTRRHAGGGFLPVCKQNQQEGEEGINH